MLAAPSISCRLIDTLLSAVFMVYIIHIGDLSASKSCSRDQSRVVSHILKEKILPAFRFQNVPVDPICKFAIDRDMYFGHEENKIQENNNRWTCNFCGKAFVNEFYLDQHFGNRHDPEIKVQDSVCLADVCDVFRCDIVSGASTPDYWDIALCLEDDMEDLYSQCEVLVNDCIPDTATKNQTKYIKDAALESVCSFLTCDKFWETPVRTERGSHIAFYAVMICMTCFGIIIYNFVFYNYFFF